MSRRFSYKITDGILYFNFREAFGRLDHKIVEGFVSRNKFLAMFKEYNAPGECQFILYFRDEFLALLERVKEKADSNGKIKVKTGDKKFIMVKVDDGLEPMIALLRSIEPEYVDYDLNYSAIEADMKYPPLKHQENVYHEYEAIKRIKSNRGMLLDAAPGTGKTYMSLSLTRGMSVDRVLILCPLATLQSVWVSSLKGEKCLFKKEINPYIIVNDNVRDFDNNAPKPIYILANYEKLEIVMKRRNELGLNEDSCIIVDESHNFGDPKSNRTIALMNLVKTVNPKNILLLSGTPVKAKAREVMSIRALLDNEFFKYEDRYFTIYRMANSMHKELLGDKYKDTSLNIAKSGMKLPEIHYKRIRVKLGSEGKKFTLDSMGKELRDYTEKRLADLKKALPKYEELHMSYVKKAKLKPDTMEQYIRNIRKIMLMSDVEKFKHKDILKECRDVEKEIASRLSKGDKEEFTDTCTILKFMMYKVRGEALGQIYLRRRIECYNAIISKLSFKDIIENAEKKTVIFSSFIENCESVANKVKKEKLKPALVFGEHTKNANASVNSFMHDDKTNPIIATYSSLSTGVELTAGNTMILIDLPFRAAEFEQTVARIWRYGQDTECFIYLVELDTGEIKNINQRTVDIVKYYDNFVASMTGHGAYQDLTQLNYDTYVADLKFESDVLAGFSSDINLHNLIKEKYDFRRKANKGLCNFLNMGVK